MTARDLDEAIARHAFVANGVSYDPETGEFTRTVTTARKWRAGQKCGHKDANGYIFIKVNKVAVKAHRLAWFITYGELPPLIDHINGDKSDNRLSNLRAVPRSINAFNVWRPRSDAKYTRLQGVRPSECGKAWAARIMVGGRRFSLGVHPTQEEAHAAYIAAKSAVMSAILENRDPIKVLR